MSYKPITILDESPLNETTKNEQEEARLELIELSEQLDNEGNPCAKTVAKMCEILALADRLEKVVSIQGDLTDGEVYDVGDTGKTYGFGGRYDYSEGAYYRKYLSQDGTVVFSQSFRPFEFYSAQREGASLGYVGDDISKVYADVTRLLEAQKTSLSLVTQELSADLDADNVELLHNAKRLFLASFKERPDSVEEFEPLMPLLTERREQRNEVITTLNWAERILSYERIFVDHPMDAYPRRWGKYHLPHIHYLYSQLRSRFDSLSTTVAQSQPDCYSSSKSSLIAKEYQEFDFENCIEEIVTGLIALDNLEKDGFQVGRAFEVSRNSGSTTSGYRVIKPDGIIQQPDIDHTSMGRSKSWEYEYTEIAPGTLCVEFSIHNAGGKNPGSEITVAADVRHGGITEAQIKTLVDELYTPEYASWLDKVTKDRLFLSLKSMTTFEEAAEGEQLNAHLRYFIPEGKNTPIVNPSHGVSRYRTTLQNLPAASELLDKTYILPVVAEGRSGETIGSEEPALKQRRFLEKVANNAERGLPDLETDLKNKADVTASEAATAAIALRESWHVARNIIDAEDIQAAIRRVNKYLKSIQNDTIARQGLQEMLNELEPLAVKFALMEQIRPTLIGYVGDADPENLAALENSLYAWLTEQQNIPEISEVEDYLESLI